MPTPYAQQVFSPVNAAKRLGVYLPATPPQFQAAGATRAQVQEWEKNPPEWLATLRRDGPHPRPTVAGRLGISISGLARAGITEALTTEQIDELRDNPPDWLVTERDRAAKVRAAERLNPGPRRSPAAARTPGKAK
jgi:hypothetical protein